MSAGFIRSAVVAAIAVPLVALVAPSASADQAVLPDPGIAEPAVTDVDSPYIWVSFCVHIPTPGSASLDWCWSF